MNTQPPTVSILFLRISSAADYFSTNETLMRNVPPVHVDISEAHLRGMRGKSADRPPSIQSWIHIS